MASPTGYGNMHGTPTAITNAAWVQIDNPNYAYEVTLHADQDFYVAYNQPQPGAADIGVLIQANTYYPKRFQNPIGYDIDLELITAIGGVWVRAVTNATTVYSDWQRE